MTKIVQGFSKLSKSEKIDWLIKTYLNNDFSYKQTITNYWNGNQKLQKLHDEFIENTLTNYYLPFAIAPNFVINNQVFALPMAIEESSVVAAASNAAKFWSTRGGFQAKVLSTTKNGQVHFNFYGDSQQLESVFASIKPKLVEAIVPVSKNMNKRGGGLLDIQLVNKTEDLDNYYYLHATFETVDAMGANFINTCLELIADTFKVETKKIGLEVDVVMSILSNYVPECLVRASVSCPVSELTHAGIEGNYFAQKFVRAIHIAKAEPRRAVTHNKGIMNGIDAVVLATGNDFRAVEAGVHAYASKNGSYQSLTHAKIENDVFHFWIEIPLAVGTIGGLTSLHPLVKVALDVLENPDAKQLMQLMAVAGLAQNFAAVKSLVTTGIQHGHMKMHLMNILNQLEASEEERSEALTHFATHTITHSEVVAYINLLRNS